jgi:hypothetical protein
MGWHLSKAMPGLESECHIERSKTMARWFAVGILAALYQWQRARGVTLMPAHNFVLLVFWGIGVNLIHTLYLFRAPACSPFYKYITVGLDLVFITVMVHFSGANESPFFYLYFLVLVSNCIRYGLVMSLYIATLVNVLYAVTLSLAPELRPTVVGGEGLKILAFWFVAFYGGAVAARIRRQAFEIEAYEETIAELRAELRKRDETPSTPSGGTDA